MTLPLSSLLSQLLVAFTIEMDNEFEHQMLHRTTNSRGLAQAQRGPWLTSFAMYSNCLKFLSTDPISVKELRRQARMSTNLDGMRRWGYITLTAPADDPGQERPNDNWLIEPTASGLLAQEKWRTVPATIEQRWKDRFGGEQVANLRRALLDLNAQLTVAYPDFLPILHYGLFTRDAGRANESLMPPLSDAPLREDSPLTALLCRPLCAFAYDFEHDSVLSLAIAANTLRVLDAAGLRNRDLPRLVGVSKESINMALGILRKANLVATGTGPDKMVCLTPRGLMAQSVAQELISDIENRWIRTFAKNAIKILRDAAETFMPDSKAGSGALLQGLEPYPGNWRASVARPSTLPHFPMVLHRGGFPDGS